MLVPANASILLPGLMALAQGKPFVALHSLNSLSGKTALWGAPTLPLKARLKPSCHRDSLPGSQPRLGRQTPDPRAPTAVSSSHLGKEASRLPTCGSELVCHPVTMNLNAPCTNSPDFFSPNILRSKDKLLFKYSHSFWAPKSLQMVTAAIKLKDAYSLEGKL